MTSDRIRRAAEVLREEAEALMMGHGIHSGDEFVWPSEGDDCDRAARASHDEMLELAADLEALAVPITEALPADPMTPAQRAAKKLL